MMECLLAEMREIRELVEASKEMNTKMEACLEKMKANQE
jgi:hypothetical protein